MRQAQQLLTHGHGWKCLIDEMRRALAIRRPPQPGQTARPCLENGVVFGKSSVELARHVAAQPRYVRNSRAVLILAS